MIPTTRDLCLWLGAASLLLSGCLSVELDELAQDAPQKQRFMLEVEIPEQPQLPRPRALKSVLMIDFVHAPAPYNGRPFVYRTGEHAHAIDYYNEFLIPPAEQLTQLTRQWMRSQSGFPLVVAADSHLTADHWLSVDLIELRADYRDISQPRAIVKIRATLVRRVPGQGERQLVFHRGYDYAAALTEAAPAALARGFSQGVTVLLGRLAADLRPFGALLPATGPR